MVFQDERMMGNCSEKSAAACCDTLCPRVAQILTRPKLLDALRMEDGETIRILLQNQEEQQQRSFHHHQRRSSLSDLVARREKIDGSIGSELSLVTDHLHQQQQLRQNSIDLDHEEHHPRVDVLGGLRIYVASWNMNGKHPPSNLAKLVDDSGARHDIYAIGLQEAPNCYMDSLFLKALGGNYCLVSSATMSSLQLYVIARTSLLPYITAAKTDKVGVGMGGMVRRQKGAVAVSLMYQGLKFIFLSSHLAPHEGNVEERNKQYERICSNVFAMKNCNGGGGSNGGTGNGCSCIQGNGAVADDSELKNHDSEEQLSLVPYSNSIEESDLVIWVGDLNYRVVGNKNSVNILINNNLEKLLWRRDQLSREVQQGKVFHNFREGPLTFRPTYKYDVGTDDYDTSAKERVPSWTDRILFKVKPKGWLAADVHAYTSIDSLKTSDHRPVKALLRVKVAPSLFASNRI